MGATGLKLVSCGEPAKDLKALTAILRDGVQSSESKLTAGGRVIPERDLMDALGVSRRAIRQALAILEAEGLLVRRQGQGTFLREVTGKNDAPTKLAGRTSPAEILEVRREIEPILARLAAFRATPLEIESMAQLLDRGAKAKTGREYEKWDAALHSAIAQSAQNALFYGIFDLVRTVRAEQGWSSLREETFSIETRDALVGQHSAIVAAIRGRDPDQAEKAMRDHLAKVAGVFGV